MKNNIKKLSEILISGKIEENLDFIKEQIPEITYMMGFEQNHPYHYLDVWEHTLEAMRNLNSTDLETRMATFLHDIGKPFSYQDEEVRHFHGHPEVSAKMAEEILRRLGFEDEFIKDVCYLVRTHDTVIDPENLDNSYEMIKKRIDLQYADTKAHTPSKIQKRLDYLRKLQEDLNEKNDFKEFELEK